jgi:glucose/arabinose dehydrogenase
MSRTILTVLWATLLLLSLQSCYRMRPSRGGGQTGSTPARAINTADIAVPEGYKIEVVTTGLTFPTGAALDDSNNLYVIEAGYSYGEVWSEPRLLRIGPGGTTTIVARGPKNGPWSGVTWHNGAFYVAEGGEMEGGRILRITKDGTIQALVANLPTMGDHHTNGPAIRDGYIYFGLGTATNSGVVGEDNWEFGWLKRKPDFHDIPCQDIVLAGQNYGSGNPLTEVPNDTATTGAYVPFGTPTTSGQVIRGAIPCSGSILRIPLQGGQPELVAWGLRNPFGLSFAPNGRLFVTENGFDERGSRRVWGAVMCCGK